MPKRNVLEIVVEGEDKASSILQNVNKQLEGVGKLATGVVVGGIAAATAAVVGFGAASLNEFNKFQKGMAEVFTLIPDASEDMRRQLEDDVQRIDARFGILAEQSVPALYQAISAGVPPDNVFEFMSTAAKASIGGVTSLETAVDGITSVVNAYGDEVINAQQASDIMFTAVRLGKTDFDQLSRSVFQIAPLMASLGLEFENGAAAVASLSAQGTPTSVAMTQIRQLLIELQKPTTQVSKLFEQMAGKSFPDFVAEGGNLSEALSLIQKGAADSGVDLAALFGSVEALNAFLGLTGDNAEGFAKNLEAMENSAGATEKAFQTMSGTMQFQIDRLRSKFQNFMQNIGRLIEPIITPIIENIGDVISAFDSFLDIDSVFDTGDFTGLAGIIASLLETLVPLRNNFVSVIEAIKAGVDPIDAISVAISNLFGPDAQQGFNDFITGIQNFFAEISRITQPIRDWIAQNVELKDVLLVIGGLIASIIIPAIAGLVVTLGTPIAIIGGLIVAVAALRQAWETDWGGIRTFVTEKVIPVLQTLADWFLNDALPAIGNFITNTAIPKIQEFIDTIKKIWDDISPGLTDLYNWFIQDALPAIMDFINNEVLPDWNDFVDTLSDIWNILQPILEDLKNGIKRAFDWIKTYIIDPAIETWNMLTTIFDGILVKLGLVQSEASKAETALNRVAQNPAFAVTNSGELFKQVEQRNQKRDLGIFNYGALGIINNLLNKQNGMPFVPRDMVVKVHRGEGILTKDENATYNNNNSKTTNNITVNLTSTGDVNKDADMFVGALRAKGIELRN